MVKDRRVDWKTELFCRFLKFTSEVMVFKESKVVRILIKTAKNQLPFGQIEMEKSLIKKSGRVNVLNVKVLKKCKVQ